MPLSSLKAKQAKPKERDYKLSDEKGLYLLVAKTGSKYWRLKYRFGGKEKIQADGVQFGRRLVGTRLLLRQAGFILLLSLFSFIS